MNSIFDIRVIKLTYWLTCNIIYGKKSFLIKESATKILRSIYFASDHAGIISYAMYMKYKYNKTHKQ